MNEDFLNITLNYMKAFKFKIRDTFISNGNLDDFYSNGKQFNGQALFGIDWIETDDCPHVNAKQRYSVSNYESVAYDNYRIQMPDRYKNNGRNDPVIHECVHFLQKNTVEDEENYIRFNGCNYRDYISQRQEYQAHTIQIAYIHDCQHEYLANKIKHDEIEFISGNLQSIKESKDYLTGVNLIIFCKINQII